MDLWYRWDILMMNIMSFYVSMTAIYSSLSLSFSLFLSFYLLLFFLLQTAIIKPPTSPSRLRLGPGKNSNLNISITCNYVHVHVLRPSFKITDMCTCILWPGVMFLITILCSYDNCVRVLILLLQLGVIFETFSCCQSLILDPNYAKFHICFL